MSQTVIGENSIINLQKTKLVNHWTQVTFFCETREISHFINTIYAQIILYFTDNNYSTKTENVSVHCENMSPLTS